MDTISFNPLYYNLWFALCGLILNVVVVLVCRMERTLPTRQGRRFLALTGTITVLETLTVYHCLWLSVPFIHELVPFETEMIITTVEKLLMLTTPFLTMLYIMEIFQVRLEKTGTALLIILPQALSYLLVLSGIFSSVFFRYNERAEMVYQYPQALLTYSNAVVYLIFVGWMLVRYGYTLSTEKRVALWFYLLMAILGGVVRIRTDSATLYEFFLSLSTMLYAYSLEDPREYMDLDAGCYNSGGFEHIVGTGLAQGQHFAVGGLYSEEMAVLENSGDDRQATEVLHVILDFLREACGEGTSIFRLNSSHLAVVIPTAEEGKAQRILEYICERFREPWQGGGGHIRLVVRACLILCPEEAGELSEVQEMLEQAVVNSRLSNKLILRAADLDMEGLNKKRRIADAVKRAMEERRFEVYYQPIYESATGRFTSAEALLRLRDPDMGFISPAEFIPVAEESGMIVQIDKYVLEEACRLLAETEVRALGIRYIECNLSVVDCIQSDLADRVLDTLRRYHISPEEINLEVTETAEEGVSYTMSENIRKLSREGVTFSLDDFGTGYSNLMRMTQMPLTIIKLDRSVVQPAFENDYSYKILLGMIRLVRTLHKRIVAEGIETEEQAVKLARLSVDHIQGFYYARPLSKDNFLRFLRDKN